MSVSPLRNLLLVLVVAGFGTAFLGASQLDGFVARAAAGFATSSGDTVDEGGIGHYGSSPHGIWSFEFE